MSTFNLNLICEQALFENALSLIAENAEKLVNEGLENIKDYADEANTVLDQAKETSKTERKEIDYSGLINLRNDLKELLRVNLWPNLQGERLESKLDDYIQSALMDPSTVLGIRGERLPTTLPIKGLRYLHRKWLGMANV